MYFIVTNCGYTISLTSLTDEAAVASAEVYRARAKRRSILWALQIRDVVGAPLVFYQQHLKWSSDLKGLGLEFYRLGYTLFSEIEGGVGYYYTS